MMAAVEAGGTKFNCGLGDENGNIIDQVSIPTTTPEETMKKVIEYFKDKKFDVMGVGSFGPIDPIKGSKTYGHITKTPKAYWSDYNLIGELKKHFDVPMEFDTDVNGAALAEAWWGAGKGFKNVMYITVGTGIGAGATVDGKMLQGLTHPEMGHISVKRHPEDTFEGTCSFHGDCLEGMAAGPAIEKRWGKKGIELAEDNRVWEMEAYYLSQALVNYILILSPEKIIMGGGVMKQKQLFPLIHKNVKEMLNGYVDKKEILEDIENYIIYPGLGDYAGFIGSFALGKLAMENNK
ncbi:MAG: ROK family protein [Leptotrichiaceae bacterium]|nr:ROK family protein [Leptotrichiaceae bacterium]MBP7026723.1 ROK family protein [Leptotrichiaceae bacterium]MBP8636434.1 ROK family protein [Leptotrichiaceae bacterium]MBP9539225.1 ROK family protein [Leptotrichiaceae bacterium]MBP9876596.1 ROK family protein [Leptotrichiaceae bacterium]